MPSEQPRREDQAFVITGISGRLGRLLARRLHSEANIIGIDRRPFPRRPKDIQLHQIDIRRKRCEDVFRKNAGRIAAVYHLNVMHNLQAAVHERQSFNLLGTQQILEYCQRWQVPKVIVLSSANVYGPRPANPQFLSEEAPLLAGERFLMIQDLVALDMMANSFFWKHPEIETVILRPVHIIGRVRNALSNYLRQPIIATILGFDPMMQLIHESDVVEALVLANRPGARGVYNIAGPGALPWSAILKVLDKPVVSIPHPLLYGLLDRLQRLKITSFPAAELDYMRFTLMVDGSRAERELGFRAQKTLRETIRSLIDEDIYDERV